MNIAIALVPSLLFGALSLLLGAFPTDIRRQNTAVMVGAGAVSLGCAAMLGSPWSLSATVWGVACGLMWTGGQVFVLWAFRAWGVSRTMPLTTALQLLLNATLGVSLFGEWRAPGALILGVVALALIMLGGYLLSIQSKQFAVAAFLFAFGAVFAQIGSLALYIRHKARAQIMRSQQTEPH